MTPTNEQLTTTFQSSTMIEKSTSTNLSSTTDDPTTSDEIATTTQFSTTENSSTMEESTTSQSSTSTFQTWFDSSNLFFVVRQYGEVGRWERRGGGLTEPVELDWTIDFHMEKDTFHEVVKTKRILANMDDIREMIYQFSFVSGDSFSWFPPIH